MAQRVYRWICSTCKRFTKERPWLCPTCKIKVCGYCFDIYGHCKRCSKTLTHNELFKKAYTAWWCFHFHNRAWPVNGGYTCPDCFQRRAVSWANSKLL